MEPTSAKPTSDTMLSRWGEPLAGAVWTGLVISVLTIASERLAGTLPADRGALGAFLTSGLAWLLGTGAALLVLFARHDGEPISSGLRWHADRIPTIGMSVVPPLLLGLLLLPEDSGFWAAALVLLSALPASFLMSDRWSRWAPHRMTGDDLAEIVSETLPEVETRSTPAPTSSAWPASAASTPLAAESEAPTAAPATDADLPAGPLSVFDPDEHDSDDETAAPDVVFQMTRRMAEDADNSASGTFRVELPAGRRQANFHVPFVPVFESAPDVECEVVDGDETLRVKVGVALPWGARIEIRRSESEDAASATVAFHATVRPASEAA